MPAQPHNLADAVHGLTIQVRMMSEEQAWLAEAVYHMFSLSVPPLADGEAAHPAEPTSPASSLLRPLPRLPSSHCGLLPAQLKHSTLLSSRAGFPGSLRTRPCTRAPQALGGRLTLHLGVLPGVAPVALRVAMVLRVAMAPLAATLGLVVPLTMVPAALLVAMAPWRQPLAWWSPWPWSRRSSW